MTRVLVDDMIFRMQAAGGVNRYFIEILENILSDHKDIIPALQKTGPSRTPLPDSFRIRRLKQFKKGPQRLRPLANALLIKSFRPDVFHSTYYQPAPSPDVKTLLTVYDFVFAQFPFLRQNAQAFVAEQKRAIETADAIVAISHETKRQILSRTDAKEERISVIYPAASGVFLESPTTSKEAEEFRSRCDIPGRYWLYVGSRNPYKNFNTLLRAFAMSALESDMHLVVAGGNDTLDIPQTDFLLQQRLLDRLHLLPGLSDADLRRAYAGATAFIYPSLAEGFGIPLLEAMSCGTPVIASDIPVFHEVAADAALFFDPASQEDLANAMSHLLDGKDTARLTAKGRERVRRFSWKEAACRMANVYRGLAS